MTGTTLAYGLKVEVPLSYERAVQRAREELGKEGFGVLTEIDVKATLKQKLDVEFRPYVILGACNPPLSHRALEAERDIGLLLPCNVIVQETAGGKVEVSAVDPVASMKAIENPKLAAIAEQVRGKLKGVIDRF